MVTKATDDGWRVRFTKMSKNVFLWPDVEDVDTITPNDIVLVLPEPSVNRRGSFTFSMSFDGYNIA